MSKVDILQQENNRLLAQLDEARKAATKHSDDRIAAERREKETRVQFDDLKTRLHAAETSNQFMRGYLARVQEDDVVREELVATGEPGGEQQMVPKRKPASFPRPDDFTLPDSNRDQFGYMPSFEERRKRARHWIAY